MYKQLIKMTQEIKMVQLLKGKYQPINEVISALCDHDTLEFFFKKYDITKQGAQIFLQHISSVKYTDGVILGKRSKKTVRYGLWKERERVAYALLDWDRTKSLANNFPSKTSIKEVIKKQYKLPKIKKEKIPKIKKEKQNKPSKVNNANIQDKVSNDNDILNKTTNPIDNKQSQYDQIIKIAKNAVDVDDARYEIATDFYCIPKDSNGGKTDAELVVSMSMEVAKLLYKRIQVADVGSLQQQATITPLTNEFNKTVKNLTDLQLKNLQSNDILKAMLSHQADKIHREVLSQQDTTTNIYATNNIENDINNLVERLKGDYFDKHPSADEETQTKVVYST